MYGNVLVGDNGGGSAPQSPVGVLDAACLSYKTEEELLTAGSCGNSSSSSSSHDSSDSKRRRQDIPSSNDYSSPSSSVKCEKIHNSEKKTENKI